MLMSRQSGLSMINDQELVVWNCGRLFLKEKNRVTRQVKIKESCDRRMVSRPLCEIEASRRFDRLFRNPLLDSWYGLSFLKLNFRSTNTKERKSPSRFVANLRLSCGFR